MDDLVNTSSERGCYRGIEDVYLSDWDLIEGFSQVHD